MSIKYLQTGNLRCNCLIDFRLQTGYFHPHFLYQFLMIPSKAFGCDILLLDTLAGYATALQHVAKLRSVFPALQEWLFSRAHVNPVNCHKQFQLIRLFNQCLYTETARIQSELHHTRRCLETSD